MMSVMARVLFALFLEVSLFTLTQQRPAPQRPLDLNYELVCEPLPNGRCILVATRSDGPSDTNNPESGIQLVADRREVRVNPGQDATLICHVNTHHDSAFIKTVWYKWSVYKHTGEWKWQSRRTAFSGNEMSLTITGAEKNTRYRCKACVTDQPAEMYSAHHAHPDSSCTVAEIKVKKGGRG